MPKGFYSRKEFEEKYNLGDFFKHIDRYTADSLSNRPDFFSFYGIDKYLIQDENSKKYRIPIHVADLLAAMINSFNYAYGNDRRGRRKEAELPFTHQQYHDYMKQLESELQKTPEFHQALVKSHGSYYNAKITDLFMDRLVERFSVLMVALFSYKNDWSSEFFVNAIEAIDSMIESLLNHRDESEWQRKSLDAQHKIFSFEDAISDTFRLLSDPTYERPATGSSEDIDIELAELFLATKRELQTEQKNGKLDSYDEIIELFNATWRSFSISHQDILSIKDENIQQMVKHADSFWTNDSAVTRLYDEYILAYRPEFKEYLDGIDECFSMGFDGSDLLDFIKPLIKIALNADDWDCAKHWFRIRDLHDQYKYDAEEYIESYPMDDTARNHFIDARYQEYKERMLDNMEFQNHIQHDHRRITTCRFYNEVKHSKPYATTYRLLMDAISNLLPLNLKN